MYKKEQGDGTFKRSDDGNESIQNQIESFEISYPGSMDAQDDFIQQLSALESDVLKVQSIYQQKLDALDELKKSILHKAFTGELTKSKGVAA